MSSCSRRITCGRTSFSSQRSMASSSAASSAGSVLRGARVTAGNPMTVSGFLVIGFQFDFVAAALHDQHGAVELAHLDAVLVQADGLDADQPGPRAALRFALVEHFGFGIERVAGE